MAKNVVGTWARWRVVHKVDGYVIEGPTAMIWLNRKGLRVRPGSSSGWCAKPLPWPYLVDVVPLRMANDQDLVLAVVVSVDHRYRLLPALPPPIVDLIRSKRREWGGVVVPGRPTFPPQPLVVHRRSVGFVVRGRSVEWPGKLALLLLVGLGSLGLAGSLVLAWAVGAGVVPLDMAGSLAGTVGLLVLALVVDCWDCRRSRSSPVLSLEADSVTLTIRTLGGPSAVIDLRTVSYFAFDSSDLLLAVTETGAVPVPLPERWPSDVGKYAMEVAARLDALLQSDRLSAHESAKLDVRPIEPTRRGTANTGGRRVDDDSTWCRRCHPPVSLVEHDRGHAISAPAIGGRSQLSAAGPWFNALAEREPER